MPVYDTFNPSDKHADIILSGGDKAADCLSSVSRSVRSSVWNRTGRFYVEFQLWPGIILYNQEVGLTTSAVPLDSYASSDSNHFYWVVSVDKDYGAYGALEANSKKTSIGWVNGAPPAWTDEMVVMMAIDFDAGKIWFGVDGVWYNSGDPASGTSPTFTDTDLSAEKELYIIASLDDVVTTHLLTDPADQYYSAPSGFNAGWFSLTIHDCSIQAGADAGDSLGAIKELHAGITGAVGAGDSDVGLRDRSEIDGAVGASGVFDVQDPYAEISGIAEAGESIQAMNTSCVVPGDAQSGGSTAAVKEHHPGITGGAGTAGAVSVNKEHPVDLLGGAGVADSFECFNFSAFNRDNIDNISYSCECTLTGSADSTTDLVVPIRSVQSSNRSGSPTFVSVVVPSYDYLDQINARSNGSIVVEIVAKVNDVEHVRELLCRAYLEDVRFDKGGKNQSITLIGHRTETWVNKEVSIASSTIIKAKKSNDKFRFTIYPDLYLKSGDTVTADGNTFDVELVSILINETEFTMTVVGQ